MPESDFKPILKYYVNDSQTGHLVEGAQIGDIRGGDFVIKKWQERFWPCRLGITTCHFRSEENCVRCDMPERGKCESPLRVKASA